MPHIAIIATEPSGDTLGAGLMEALRRHGGEALQFSGLGGPKMAALGLEGPFDIRELSIVGYVEGLLAYTRILKRVEETVAHIEACAPDAVVLIDSWGFMIRVAERLRQRAPHITQIKYVAPQVWASRPKRARNLARAVDHVLTLFPFEPPYYEKYDVTAEAVGHPVFDTPPAGDGAAFRARHDIAEDAPLVAVLFGSRRKEAERLAEPFAAAVAALETKYGERLRIIAPTASAIADQVSVLVENDPRLARIVLIPDGEKHDAFAAADAALACSGTVVTELAMAETPTVVAYKLDTLSYMLAKILMTAPHISLVNMALSDDPNDRVAPEFVQDAVQGEALAKAVSAFLDDGELATLTREQLRAAVQLLRGSGGSAADRAANAVLAVLQPQAAMAEAAV